jgi:hypothetical protein
MRQEIRRLTVRIAALAAALTVPAVAHASFLSGDTLDTAANVLAWFIIIVMPPLAIAIFLAVHVLPEKIAEKRHHPQKDSIKVLCILSLFFGGMLWPFAWLWAYTRPTLHKSVFGTERHESYYLEMEHKFRAGELSVDEIADVRSELHTMAAKGNLPAILRRLLDDLDAVTGGTMAPPAPAAQAPVLTRPAPVAHEGDD